MSSRSLNRFFPIIAVTFGCHSLVGCSTLNSASVQATAGAPIAAEVAEVNIPYDSKFQKFVVAIEPLRFASNMDLTGGDDGSKIIITSGSAVSDQISAQLTTALSNVGNIAVLDKMAVKKKKDGMLSAKLKKGEVGPYVVKGTITEFNENAEVSADSAGGSLGWTGLVMGIAGAVAGKPALGWTGAGIAAANPSYHEAEASRKGVVGIDLVIVDGRDGRIVKSFSTKGTFIAKSAKSGFSLFGIGKNKSEFASSAIGQAIRAALNDAAKKTFDALGHAA